VALTGGLGTAAAGDVNREIRLANLAFASAIPTVDAYAEAAGELSYDVSRRLTLAGHLGYLWREHSSGRLARRVSGVPAVLGVTWHLLPGPRLRAGPTAAAGLLLRAAYKGQDPLGGVRSSGTGKILEGGVEGEYFLGGSFCVAVRGLGRWAVARRVLPDGGDIDVSGVLLRGALRVYFRR
jgi:hypothetical protein